MPVRNAGRFLDASIESILGQTYSDFEFVLLDDASTDGSREILHDWQRRDSRIRVFESDAALGLAGSSNAVVSRARAPLCARMDADDISDPERLRIQVEVLRERPETPLVGTLWEGIDVENRTVRPRDRGRLHRASVFAPFPHGSIMFRRRDFDAVGGYRAACAYWEDFDLYGRLAARGPLLVIADVLYRYRFHAAAATARPDEQHLAAIDLMYRCADRAAAAQDYSTLLNHSGNGTTPDPRTLRSVAAPLLWAGEPTRILKSLGRLGNPVGSTANVRALFWAAWGELSPGSLRFLLRVFIRLRDRAASRTIHDGMVVQWRRSAGSEGGSGSSASGM